MSAKRKIAAPEELRRLLETGREKLLALPVIKVGDARSWDDHHAGVRKMADALGEAGFRISETGAGARLSAGGITATGTGGVEAALRNWLVAARRRLEAAE